MGGAKASAVHSEEQLARWSTELKVLRQENGAGSGERRRLQGERVEPEISCQRGTKIIFLNCRQIMSNAARNFGKAAASDPEAGPSTIIIGKVFDGGSRKPWGATGHGK